MAPILAENAQIPNWIDNNRIQAQTGLFHFTGKPKYNNVAKELKLLGVNNAYIRHVKLDWAGPLWPSKIPLNSNGIPVFSNQADHLSKMVMNAHKNGLKFIGYYWESGEGVPLDGDKSKLLRSHLKYDWVSPKEWLCRDLTGKLVPVSLGRARPLRGYHLDLLSDYKYFLLDRLKEMIDRGVDALYFDERHLPKAQVSACYGSTIEKLYLKTGHKLPKINDWSDPNYKRYIEFQSEKMADAFQFLIDGIKQAYPSKNIPFIISGTYLASYTLPHMSLKLASVANITKIEYLLGARDGLNGKVFKKTKNLKKPPRDIQIALGWVIPRDAGDGRPVHIWHPHFTSLASIKTFIASTQAYGAITAINIPTNYLSGVRLPRAKREKSFSPDTPYSYIKEGFEFGNAIAKHLGSIRPSREIVIYLSEKQRKRYNNFESYWRKQLWPVNAAFEVLVRNGLPAAIITDEQIEHLRDSSVRMIISHKDNLTAKEVIILRKNNPSLKIFLFDDLQTLSYDKTHDKAYAKLSHDIIKVAKKVSNIRVDYGQDANISKPHAVYFNAPEGTKIIAISNDFSQFGLKDFSQPPEVKKSTLIFTHKPKKITELLTKKNLKVFKTPRGLFKVTITPFQELSLISIIE